jgi:Domain of unknown function (DUF4116)
LLFGKRRGRSYFANLLAERASVEKKQECSAADVIDVVSLGDPSEDLSYLDWMLKFLYEIGGGMGDTSNLSKFVSLHHEIKHLLPARDRELGNVHSMEEFAKILSPYLRDGAAIFGDKVEQYRRNALDQSETTYEDQEYLIVFPWTRSAAVYWCAGTVWTFDLFWLRSLDLFGRLEPPSRYLGKPSLIFISKTSGRKIIVGISPPFCRDEKGGQASFWTFLGRPKVLNILGTWLLRESTEFASTMQIQHLTREVASILVSKNPYAIKTLPENVLDRDLYVQIIREDWANIKYVPTSVLDRDIYIIYIAQTGAILNNVPLEFRDREICLEAIRSNPKNLKSVPENFLDAEFYNLAFEANPAVLSEFPRKMITRDLCLRAIEAGGIVLTKAFDEFLDREICERSVERHPYLIGSVPERFLDRTLIRRAILRWGGALQHVKPHLRDRELCLEAVNQAPVSVAYVPRDILDRDILLSAVRRDGSILAKLPTDIKDDEVCRVAMRSNLDAARHVPRKILRHLASEFESEYAEMKALAGPRASIKDTYAPQLAELKAALAGR